MFKFSLCLLAAAARPPSKFGSTRGALAPLRLQGTVTAFKHRRGYGFIIAEGVVSGDPRPVLEHQQRAMAEAGAHAGANAGGAQPSPAAGVPSASLGQFFFNRGCLDGGFFVTEGERVSFGVERDMSEPRHPSTEGGRSYFRATHIRFYDRRSKRERPVTPVALSGVVVRWDRVRGHGVIGELDTAGTYHPDLSPKFFFTVEDVDLAPGAEMREGRYVRFCVEEDEDGSAARGGGAGVGAAVGGGCGGCGGGAAAAEDDDGDDADDGLSGTSAGAADRSGGAPSGGGAELSAAAAELGASASASRVIVDVAMERRRGAKGRAVVPAAAAAGGGPHAGQPLSADSRFAGVVRQVVRGADGAPARFGFITDGATGTSIFFHGSDAFRAVQPGDRVTYLLRELSVGKHAGKMACMDVRLEGAEDTGVAGAGGAAAASGRATANSSNWGDDDDDFDLLE